MVNSPSAGRCSVNVIVLLICASPFTMLEYKVSMKSCIDNYKTTEEMIHECFDTAVMKVAGIEVTQCNLFFLYK